VNTGAAEGERATSARFLRNAAWGLQWSLPSVAKSQKVRATFVVLARNTNIWGIANSIQQAEDRFNKRYNYDWVFLNDEDFTDEFKNVTTSLVSGNAHYGKIPKEHWSEPEWINQTLADAKRQQMSDDGVGYGGSLSYRHMCRFESGFFFRHPLMEQYDYYWRVEPDVNFYCDMPYDPFKFMHDNNKKYSFVLAFEEFVNTCPTLWNTTRSFMEKYPEHLPDDNSLSIVSNDGGLTYNKCHFWSNFEIASLNFLRSQAYMDFFNHLDRAGGFFYERWGDAPVHSIAAALLLPREQIHFFDDVGYYHFPYLHCPRDAARRLKLGCACEPSKSMNTGGGTCTGKWLDLNGEPKAAGPGVMLEGDDR
jgi:alpha 1,2-mannosyltransferase